MTIAWRTDSYGTQEARLADVVSEILSNRGDAGLIDLNINQKQKRLEQERMSLPQNVWYIWISGNA